MRRDTDGGTEKTERDCYHCLGGKEEKWEELREHEKNLSFDRLLQCLQKYSQI